MPGLDGTGRLFEPFTDVLPEGITTRVVSYPADERLSLADHAAIARRAIGNERVILVAESFSGLVALQLLREGGVPVTQVIFVASFAAPPRPFLRHLRALLPMLARGIDRVPAAAWRLFCLGADASAEEIRWLRDVLKRVDPAVVAHRLSLVSDTVFEPGLPLEVPASYLQAQDDRLVPAGAAARMRPLFRAFETVPLKGPHFLLQARYRECARVVAERVSRR